MDEISERTGLTPTPLTWPVGIAGDFRGVLDRADGTYRRFTRTAGGATIAPEETLPAAAAAEREGDAWHAGGRGGRAAGRDQRPSTTSRCSWTASPRRCCSPPRSPTSASAPCWTPWSTSRPPPPAQPDADGAARPLTSRSAPSCSRCRPAWTPRTATGWPSSASARASSSAAWWSRTRAPAGRSPPSTPSTCSAASGRASTAPTPATSSAWSTPPRSASATPSTPTSR